MRDVLMLGGYYAGQRIACNPEKWPQLTMPAPSELSADSCRRRSLEPVTHQPLLYVRHDWHIAGETTYVYALHGMSPLDSWNALVALAGAVGRLTDVKLLRKEKCPCGCENFIVKPYFGCQCSSLPESEANELLAMARDAERYRHLRDGNAFMPEEQGVHGGEALDKLCDEGTPEGALWKGYA